ncbi:MAG: malonic semialdehyde reductase [Pseudomonadota bacterium]
MADPVNDNALNVIFRDGRSYNSWQDKDVPETLIRAVYELAKWGPTSANGSPGRFLFLRSQEAKERLKPHLDASNVDKAMTAPWVAILAHDLDFHEEMPRLFPHNPGAKKWFSDEAHRELTAFRNGSLQSAYFLVAARAVGLDCGPMSGFDNDGVDQEFFIGPGGERARWRSNWICNVGYGDKTDLFERSPRLEFDDACEIL